MNTMSVATFLLLLAVCLLSSATLRAGECTDPAGCGEITRFEVAPTVVEVNGTLSATWDSLGMWECFGTHFPNHAWSGYPGRSWLPRGSKSFNIGPINPGVYTMRLECRNGPVFDEAAVTIHVVPES